MMIDRMKRFGSGIALWIRTAPRRLVEAVVRATGLPAGFWYVVALAVSVSVLVSAGIVAAVYSHYNAVGPARWVEASDE